jgi:hypothetical protein
MKTVVQGEGQQLSFCCGIIEFGEFEFGDVNDWYFRELKDAKLGESGLGCAAFVDSAECRLAYEELKGRFNIAYQSSVRKNTLSGNLLFFVVYDGKRK